MFVSPILPAECARSPRSACQAVARRRMCGADVILGPRIAGDARPRRDFKVRAHGSHFSSRY
ncbi:hypothetical protein B0H19DRAFT_1132978 [Mycena capillaripes]|nr:hypothetical protein B0H19DRAFT_1132978 [Mycena capillaripes]